MNHNLLNRICIPYRKFYLDISPKICAKYSIIINEAHICFQ